MIHMYLRRQLTKFPVETTSNNISNETLILEQHSIKSILKSKKMCEKSGKLLLTCQEIFWEDAGFWFQGESDSDWSKKGN